jgi:serine/threonine protein kinase
VLASGSLEEPFRHFHHFMVLEPFGRHVLTGSEEPLEVFAHVLADVCNALECAFVALGLLHQDISYGNIIVVEDCTMPCGHRGVLIDWDVSNNAVANTLDQHITGTRLFMAHRLSFSGHVHSLHDDLESLFYVALHVSMKSGRLPWAHSPVRDMDGLKYWYLNDDKKFKELLENDCAEPSHGLLKTLRDIIKAALATPGGASEAAVQPDPLGSSAGPSPALAPPPPPPPVHVSAYDHDLATLRAFRKACGY